MIITEVFVLAGTMISSRGLELLTECVLNHLCVSFKERIRFGLYPNFSSAA